MTMEVVAICRSQKKMRPKAAAILDRYLFRIGDRTWKGRASTACLKRISTDLKAIASRNLAVAVHRARTASTLEAPIFVVGSKSRFSPTGMVPISVQSSGRSRRNLLDSDKSEVTLVGLAALMHDIGKCTNLFQGKLSAAIAPVKRQRKTSEKNAKMPDVVRHEVFSAFFFDKICQGLSPDDLEGLALRLKAYAEGAVEFDAAAKAAGAASYNLAKNGGSKDTLEFEMDLSKLEKPLPATLMLILTHHRLISTDSKYKDIIAENHANFNVAPRRNDFSVERSNALWLEPTWLSSLIRVADEILTLKEAISIRGDIYARTGLMLGDHVGSHEKKASTEHSGALANTTKEDNELVCAADSVSTHTRRVYQASKAAMRMIQRQMNSFPAIEEETCPESLRNPGPAPQRFVWQSAAAAAAAKISNSSAGGFFGCILAGTGTGKTRGAPTILANAAFSDADPERRSLRYNLALGLRTLAHQSAEEYVVELGFSPDDVAVLVGGETISWDEENERDTEKAGSKAYGTHETSGSEERFVAVTGVRSEKSDIADDVASLAGLGLDCDRHLPAFMERVISAAQSNGPMIRRMQTSPLVVATIDHLMPAADARRSWHLPAMLRVSSSDLIIDEIDQFSEEDLMAIERLIEIVGAFGRRVIIMSATLPLDVANQMFSAYRRGFTDFCRRTKADDRVHVLLTGDCEDALTTETDPDFPTLYSEVARNICSHLQSQEPLRRARILAPAQDWPEIAGEINTAISDFHDRLCAIDGNGIRISAGIVRMTRVKHVQELAQQFSDMPDDHIHREYVILHSRLPQIQRSWIEHNLRKALNRKGESPDKGLISLLGREGVYQRAAKAQKKDIALIVITSPVIETGNDVDFDYAVIDPSSLRAVVQTAGRVRRHRSKLRDANNIALLYEYSVSLLEGGLASRPGVETKPCRAVSGVSLDHLAGRDAPTLIGAWIDMPIDASILLEKDRISALREKEEELRENYRSSQPGRAIRDLPLARWSSRRPLDLRFRRSTPGEVTAFPELHTTGEITWWSFTGKYRNQKVDSGLAEREQSIYLPAILADGIEVLINQSPKAVTDSGRVNFKGGVSFFPAKGAGAVSGVRDNILGVMKSPP